MRGEQAAVGEGPYPAPPRAPPHPMAAPTALPAQHSMHFSLDLVFDWDPAGPPSSHRGQ